MVRGLFVLTIFFFTALFGAPEFESESESEDDEDEEDDDEESLSESESFSSFFVFFLLFGALRLSRALPGGRASSTSLSAALWHGLVDEIFQFP